MNDKDSNILIKWWFPNLELVLIVVSTLLNHLPLLQSGWIMLLCRALPLIVMVSSPTVTKLLVFLIKCCSTVSLSLSSSDGQNDMAKFKNV